MQSGFRISGRWSFASGVHHAKWIILGEIPGGGTDRADGFLFLVPASQYRIDDDWHTVGMAGTGSASVVLEDVFVPAHRALATRDINAGAAPGTRLNTAPLYRMPVLGYAQLALAAVPIGAAIGMVEDFAAFLRGRPASELLHERLSEAAAETHAATLVLMDCARDIMARLTAGGTLGEADAARSGRDGAYAVRLARQAVTRLFEVTGGHGLYLSGPMQRAFRDVLGAAAHGSLRLAAPRGPLRAVRADRGSPAAMNFDLSDEQRAFQDAARAFARAEMAPHAARWDAEKIFPVETLRAAAALGFGGIYVREDFGGSGLSRLDAALIFEELAAACPSTAAFLSIHNMAAWMIDRFGAEAQRRKFLPALCRMEHFASYCLTEPDAGSDAAALEDPRGRDDDDYVLNGSKAFISGGGRSDLYVAMVRTGAPGRGHFLPRRRGGLARPLFGAQERKLGWNSQPTAMVMFEECRVPVANRIGGEGTASRSR